MDLLAAKVWTYWLSIFIIVPIVLLVIGIGIASRAAARPRRVGEAAISQNGSVSPELNIEPSQPTEIAW